MLRPARMMSAMFNKLKFLFAKNKMNKSYIVFRYLHDHDGFPVLDFITHFKSEEDAVEFSIRNGYTNRYDLVRDEIMAAYDTTEYINSYVVVECVCGSIFGKEDNYILFKRGSE